MGNSSPQSSPTSDVAHEESTEEMLRRLDALERTFEEAQPTPGSERAAQWLSWGLKHGSDHAALRTQYKSFARDPQALREVDEHQIECDLHRTFPEVPGFSDPDNMARFRTILSAVAFYHEGGYAQAMNYIAGVVLIQLGDSGVADHDIFLLTMVVLKLLPGYHDRSLSGAQADSRVLTELLMQEYPECATDFESNGFTPDLFFVEWLLTVMTSACSVATVSSIFGVLLEHGQTSLLRACVAVMVWCHQQLPAGSSLMQIKEIALRCSVEQMAAILQGVISNPIVSDQVILDLRKKHLEAIQLENSTRSMRQEISRLRSTSNLTQEHGKALQARMLQLSRGGEIDLAGFRAMLSELFPKEWGGNDHTAELFFSAFDTDSSGTLDVTELLRGVGLCCSKDIRGFVSNMFGVFDADESGGLDLAEVQRMVRWLCAVVYLNPPTTAETDQWVELMFATIDQDHSGTLELDEIMRCYVSMPLITECFSEMPSVYLYT